MLYLMTVRGSGLSHCSVHSRVSLGNDHLAETYSVVPPTVSKLMCAGMEAFFG
jgi:hypothetical protein